MRFQVMINKIFKIFFNFKTHKNMSKTIKFPKILDVSKVDIKALLAQKDIIVSARRKIKEIKNKALI